MSAEAIFVVLIIVGALCGLGALACAVVVLVAGIRTAWERWA